ncbi:LacI family DNA-binding transcriptional regulator [Streptomyces sp. 8N616]|uniref:LacI family DNA-binding transcriptional regulator n=1 Tax=Streptomyces sp. 8N616 TaxID=3457414 RepID=UPI003FD51AD3
MQEARSSRPTMKDIACRVGVSIKSVSRVLNGEPGVSPATAQRITDVARELGFRRNDLARNLRQGTRSGVVGLVLKHSATRFFGELVRGVDEVAAQANSVVVTANTRTAGREKETLQMLSSRRLDGLLIVPTGDDHSFLAPEQATGIPLVFVDRPPRGLSADTVLADDGVAGAGVAEHLLRHGHHRTAVIGAAAGQYTVDERVRGFREAMHRAGTPVGDDLVRLGVEDIRAARAATAALLGSANPPTALFTLNSVCTTGALLALHEAGVRDRLALVGFDDFETADLLSPPVTVVAHDLAAMGRTAARRLFDRVAGLDEPPRTFVIPTELIARGSGEIPGPGRTRMATAGSARHA